MGINIQTYGGSHQELLPKLSALNLQLKSLKRPIMEHIFGNVVGLIKLKFFFKNVDHNCGKPRLQNNFL